MKVLALLALAAFAAPVSAQTLDWSKDIVEQVRASVAPPRLEGRLVSARGSVPAAPDHQHTTASYMAVDFDIDRVEAVYSDCDDAIDDCTFLLYDFPQLKADGPALTYGGETVAVLSDGGRRVDLAPGYRLTTRRTDDGATYRIEAVIEKASPLQSYYQGTLTVKGETRAICFALSPEKVDSAAGDPDLDQGVFVSQAIPSFQEDRLAACATSLEFNGDYIKTCGGLFMIGAASLKYGDVFTQMERYNQDGTLKLQPVGTFELKPAAGCPN